MDKYSQNYAKQKKKEIILTVIITLIAVVGVLCELLVNRNIVFVCVDDLTGLSLALLQMEATLVTITIAVIALISGSISDSHMGVGVCYYCLKRKPIVFTQLFVIFLELFVLGISVVLHILAKYNVVIAFFIASIVLLFFSIQEIYRIFADSKSVNAEIEAYIDHIFAEGENNKSFWLQYTDSWKNIANNQDKDEFKMYQEKYFNLIRRLLDKESDITTVNELSYKLSVSWLRSEYTTCKIRGIEFVYNFYKEIRLWINQNRDEVRKFNGRISLIEQIGYDWFKALKTIEAEKVEDILNWKTLSSFVIEISLQTEKDDKANGEIDTINSIARSLGYYLKKQYQHNNNVDISKWKGLVKDNLYYRYSRVPNEIKNDYFMKIVYRDFCVCYGFILEGQIDLVKNALFLEEIKNLYDVDNKYSVIFNMLVHCFMYYLAFVETTKCIEKEKQDRIKAALLDKEVISSMDSFYYKLMQNADLLTEEIEGIIEGVIGKYELFPLHDNSKQMISYSAVRAYFLFIALKVNSYPINKENLMNCLNVDKYSIYLGKVNYETVRKQFKTINRLFTQKTDGDEVEKRIDEMLLTFTSVMSGKYKNKMIENAKEVNKQFESDKEQLSNDIKKEIFNNFLKIFGGLSAENAKMPNFKKVCIYHERHDTQWINLDINKIYAEPSMGKLLEWLVHDIESRGKKNIISRSEKFKTDAEFRKLLNNNKYDNLLGAQYIFGCRDYSEYEKHAEFINEKKCIFVPDSYFGIAFKDNLIQLEINDVEVKIYSPNLSDCPGIRDEEAGVIRYKHFDIDTEFSEEEYKEFAQNQWRYVDIFVSISLGLAKNYNSNSLILLKR